MSDKSGCSCGSAPKLIFPCSGGADVGELADQTARRLTRDGVGKMYCLAGIGGRVSGIMASTEGAGKVLAIDGCPVNCARKTLEQAGFSTFEHFNLSEIGLQKGAAPVTNENIAKVAQKAVLLMAC